MSGARCRGGFTMAEMMLAGAISILSTLALMEGLAVSARMSRENSQLMAADAFAWDTAWKWLNKAYADLPSQAAGAVFDSAVDADMAVTAGDCPAISREKTGADPRVVVRVVLCSGSGAVQRHGMQITAKRIDVDVEWGAEGGRRCLNGLCGEDIACYGRPVSVYKSQIDRGMPE